jgi:predicted lipoprotein with Yx(FWY)xxD motif
MKFRSISALAATSATLIAIAATVLFAIQGSVAQAAQPHTAATTISTRHNKLGTFLVGPSGHTLYLWEADSKNHSTCAGSCADVWPPLMLHGKLKAAGGVKAGQLGSTARKGGRQVTYDGHPLYYYVTDTKAGQTTGEGSDSFGAPWYVLSTAGAAIKG